MTCITPVGNYLNIYKKNTSNLNLKCLRVKLDLSLHISIRTNAEFCIYNNNYNNIIADPNRKVFLFV